MTELTPVRVRAKFFFEGEKKFFIKGVTYGPFAPDANGEYFGTPAGVAAVVTGDTMIGGVGGIGMLKVKVI